MTAFQALQFTGSELQKIANMENALKLGTVKKEDLAAEVKKHLTEANKNNLVAANKKALATCYDELKEWL